jgi:hypothetical protein
MAQRIAEPAQPGLLDIFGPDSSVPIPLPVLEALLERLLPALPGYAEADAAQQQTLRQLTMHELAAWMPGDVAEASIAATLVALNAHAVDCLRRAALPDIVPEDALRVTRQANSLLRTMATGRRDLERRQTARRKAAEAREARGGDAGATDPPRAPGSLAPAQGQAPDCGISEAEQAPAPPRTEQAPAAAQPTAGIRVSASEVMRRFNARQIRPGETPEQVWEQCVDEAYAAAQKRVASRGRGGDSASPAARQPRPQRGEPDGVVVAGPGAPPLPSRAA